MVHGTDRMSCKRNHSVNTLKGQRAHKYTGTTLQKTLKGQSAHKYTGVCFKNVLLLFGFDLHPYYAIENVTILKASEAMISHA